MLEVVFNEAEVKLVISPESLEVFKRYIQHENCPESGGVLLGTYRPDGKVFTITEVTTPTKKDRFGEFFFIRSKNSAQRIINRRWKDSKGIINYLGEWHTHPCDYPAPSSTDRKLLKSIVADNSNVWSYVFIIIVGRKSFYVGVGSAESKGKIIESKEIRR